MRETKFRAWGKKSKYMQAVCYISWLAGGLKAEGAGVYIDNGWVEVNKECKNQETVEPEVILMQYTGLKDKNGKEIYEGDIVKWYINDIVRTGPVYYDTEGACFWIGKSIETGMVTVNDWMRGEYEIIGNIYEQPELLEAT